MKLKSSLTSSDNILTLEELNKEYETRKKQLKASIKDITKIRNEAKKYYDSLDDEERLGNLQSEMRNANDYLKQLSIYNKELSSLEDHYLKQRLAIRINEGGEDNIELIK